MKNSSEEIEILNEDGLTIKEIGHWDLSNSQFLYHEILYHEMKKEEIDVIKPLLKDVIPQFTERAVYKLSINRSFDNAIRGSYFPILAQNTHLAASKTMPGYKIGTELNNSNNKIQGITKWKENTSSSKSLIPANIVDGVFNALSWMTGQHFLKQINTSLKKLQNTVVQAEARIQDSLKRIHESIVDIQDTLEIQNRSKILADIDIIKEISRKKQSILADNDERNRALNKIDCISKEVLEYHYFCLGKVNTITQVSYLTIDHLNCLEYYLDQSYYSAYLYICVKILESELSRMKNNIDISDLKDDLLGFIAKFKTNRDAYIKRIHNNNKAHLDCVDELFPEALSNTFFRDYIMKQSDEVKELYMKKYSNKEYPPDIIDRWNVEELYKPIKQCFDSFGMILIYGKLFTDMPE